MAVKDPIIAWLFTVLDLSKSLPNFRVCLERDLNRRWVAVSLQKTRTTAIAVATITKNKKHARKATAPTYGCR